MMKLTRPPKPADLTDELAQELLEEYGKTGSSVWNQDFIKDALLTMSHQKCCYCEVFIKSRGAYMEIDHFLHKSKYADQVIKWENLLPSCKRCNGKKHAHDAGIEPIIDPSLNDPKKHLKYWRYRLKGKDKLGETTVDVLYLNDYDRLIKLRFDIGNTIHSRFEDLHDELTRAISSGTVSTRKRNRIMGTFQEILAEGLPPAEFAATTATIIASSQEYANICQLLQANSMWDQTMKSLAEGLNSIALDYSQ